MSALPPSYRGLMLTDSGGTVLLFDATVQDMTDSVLAVTQHPVEAGPNISDNARLELSKFHYKVFISETPTQDWNGYGQKIIHTQLKPQDSGTAQNYNPAGLLVGAIGSLLAGDKGPTNQIALAWDSPFHPVVDAYNRLLFWQANTKLLNITTTKYDFNNCLLTNVRMNRSAQEGTGALFELELTELRQVTLGTADSPLSEDPRGAAPAHKGSASNEQVDPEDVQSLLHVAKTAGLKAAGL